MRNLQLAVSQTGVRSVAIAGGVSANSGLRQALLDTGKQKGWQVFIPAFEYCTDNAAMIAITAYYQFLGGKFSELDTPVSARSNW